MPNYVTFYPAREEIINVVTHFTGFLLAIAGTVLLIIKASSYGDVWHVVSFSIYGASMVVLYLASTLYHGTRQRYLRSRFNIFDHSAIYFLIAGTYTPFTLVTLRGPMGWTLFGITWGLAVVGITLKVFFAGKYERISTWSYILMGWVAVIAAKPLYENLSSEALFHLIAGGVAYTIGAVFYSLDKIKFNHAIFHFWVLAGSGFHFISIYGYLV